MKLLIASLVIFLVLLTNVFAKDVILVISSTGESFKDKVMFSPEVAFLWNFQRGVEELYRFVKFTTVMRVGYSLELGERRIGEMEVLVSKNKTEFVPTIENDYELELNKIEVDLGSKDVLSNIITPIDVRKNVTERLNYDKDVLNIISTNVTEPVKAYFTNAIKKTSSCIDFINSL